jgi:4-amino-4-deoxy-L-arabinose transferase-like glycosyltransferase
MDRPSRSMSTDAPTGRQRWNPLLVRRQPSYQELFFLVILGLLTLAGLYLRLLYVRTTSPYIDEYTTMWVAQRTLEHGYPVFSTGSIYAQGLLFTYLDAVFIRLFQFSEQVARMPSLIISTCTIPCLYFVGKKMFSAYEGLIAAAILSFSPQAVLWGGRARNYALIQFLVLFATLFFYRWAISEERALFRNLFLLTFIAAVFTHNVAMLLYPAFLCCAFLRQGWRWFFRRDVILSNVLMVLGMAGSLYLYRRLRPPGWGEVGEGRLEVGLSFNLFGALQRYKPFFLGLDDLPFAAILTLLCILGVAYLLWRVLKARSFRALFQQSDQDGALAYLGFLFAVIVLEMFFVVNERRWSPRYFFLEAPIFYLIASNVLVRIARFGERCLRPRLAFVERIGTQGRTLLALVATGLVIVLVTVVSWPAAALAVSRGEYGYDRAFQYVREHRVEGDTVMTFALTPCVIYLGEGGCDYVAMEKDFHSYATKSEGRWIEAWAGIPILFTDEALRETIEQGDRTWFVVDEFRLRTRYTDEFIQYVWDRTELVAKEGGVFVFLSESPAPPAMAIERSLYYDFDDKAALVGYGLSGDFFEAGDVVHVSLRWQGLTHILESYSVFVHLIDGDGRMWAQHDGVPIGALHPTTHWVAGEIISDPRELTLPPDIPRGRYRVEVGMYLPETMQHLSVTDARMQPLGDRAIVDYVRVGDNSREPLEPAYLGYFSLNNKVTLWGYDIQPPEAVPGSTVRVTLYWRGEQPMDEDYTVFVHVVDDGGHIWAQQDNQPEGGFFQTSFWEEGEVVQDEYELSIAQETPPGQYNIEVGMYVLLTGQRLSIMDETGQIISDGVVIGLVEVAG